MSSIPEEEQPHTGAGEPQSVAPAAEDPPEASPDGHIRASASPAWPAEALPGETSPLEPTPSPTPSLIEPVAVEPPIFQTSFEPEVRPPARIPHFGHLLLLVLILIAAFAAAIVVMLVALHFHVYGISTIEQTKSEIHYTLGSEGLGYLFTLLGCLIVFPLLWNKPFFAGLQWNVATALRLRWRLVSAAFICFLLALLNSVVLPGPSHAPIEDLFKEPGAAWLLFAFGVTFAPFFEEMFFRGFLLPAFCTTFDWIAERLSHAPETSTGWGGAPRWSTNANLVAGTVTAVPFAATCALVSKRYLIVGAVLLFAWCCTMAMVWMIARRRPAASRSMVLIDDNGHPLWSLPAMACISIFTSIPFALMHAPQTGFSVGPFFLLVGVSVVLCGVRLWTRSLASSTLVHASYNFMLFFMMLVGTHGFRHMDKM
jgi:membrane protease YdiL (CAAX protease family)